MQIKYKCDISPKNILVLTPVHLNVGRTTGTCNRQRVQLNLSGFSENDLKKEGRICKYRSQYLYLNYIQNNVILINSLFLILSGKSVIIFHKPI